MRGVVVVVAAAVVVAGFTGATAAGCPSSIGGGFPVGCCPGCCFVGEGEGELGTVTAHITVEGFPAGPLPQIPADAILTLNATASQPGPNAVLQSFQWQLLGSGDTVLTNPIGDSTGFAFDGGLHPGFGAQGTYTVILTATDTNFVSGSDSINIFVGPAQARGDCAFPFEVVLGDNAGTGVLADGNTCGGQGFVWRFLPTESARYRFTATPAEGAVDAPPLVVEVRDTCAGAPALACEPRSAEVDLFAGLPGFVFVEAAGAASAGAFVLRAERVLAIGDECDAVNDAANDLVCAGDAPCVDDVCGDLEDRLCAVEGGPIGGGGEGQGFPLSLSLPLASSACAPARTDLVAAAVRYRTGAAAGAVDLAFAGNDGTQVFVERRDTCELQESATCDAAAFTAIPPSTDLTLVIATPVDAPATFLTIDETPTPSPP